MDEIDQLLEDRDAISDDLRMIFLRAQQKMAIQANKHRWNVEYQEGDLVFLKLRPYRQQILAKRKYEKLSPRYYGPYRISQKIGKVAYKLDLPPTVNIHHVFLVSQLHAVHGTPCQQWSATPTQWRLGIDHVTLVTVRSKSKERARIGQGCPNLVEGIHRRRSFVGRLWQNDLGISWIQPWG